MTVSEQIGELTGEWILDPSRSTISLATKSMGGLARVRGTFGQVTGEGAISPAGDVTGTLTIAAASIDTKNTKRDKHLRSADFFDSDNYPDIAFTVTGIEASGQNATVTGVLTIRGSTRALSFDAATTIKGDGEVWLDARVLIDRADFGITWNMLGMASMISTLTVHAVFGRIPAR
jgi:polyisoprenoid-binding protein YceI